MEQEISLRELIEALLRWKWFIVVITTAAVFVSGVLSFFVLAPTYEASATLWVNMPEMESHRVAIRDAVTLTEVIDQLQLDPEKFTVATLQEAIRAENPRNTSLLQVFVRTSDPQIAQELANAIAEQFVVRQHQESQLLIASTTATLQSQIDDAEKRYSFAFEAYTQFLSQSTSVVELQQEISAKTSIVTDFRSRLIAKQIELASNTQGLETARTQLANTPEKLVTSRSLVDDPFLQDVVRQRLNASPEATALVTMKSEEINPIYIDLQQGVNAFVLKISQLNAEKKALLSAIATAQNALSALQVGLARQQAEQDKLLANIGRLRGNIDLLSARYEEARLATALERPDVRTRIVAPALEPLHPIAPRRVLNMAVAAVLGLMVSVFLAFFLEYWRASAVSPKLGHDKSGRGIPA